MKAKSKTKRSRRWWLVLNAYGHVVGAAGASVRAAFYDGENPCDAPHKIIRVEEVVRKPGRKR